MTRNKYISHLRAMYLAANASSTEDDGEGLGRYREPWMHGDECAVHCQAFDKIAIDMCLHDNWLEEGYDEELA